MHDPVEEAATTEMLRAAMVVFDDFEGVPVTVTQVPAASELTVSVTDLEKFVVDVQLTVVWPLLGFCTSMVEPDSAATLPVAPMGGVRWGRRRSGGRSERRRRHERRGAGGEFGPSAGDWCFGWSVSPCRTSLCFLLFGS